MRLHNLKIKNFRVLKDVYIEFPQQVIGIIGDNGAGKSSIVEAIAWALYGNQAARSGKNEIKSTFSLPDEACEVTLDFTINTERYRVTRRLVGKKERPEVQLYRGEASESIGVSETKRYVGELLGLDWKGFLTSFLARQQELNTLSDLQPARRRDHLAGMLGVDRIDRIIGRVKEDTRLNQAKAQLLEKQLAERGLITQRISDLSQKKTELTAKQAKISSSLQQAEKEAKERSERLTKIQEARSVWLQVTGKIDSAQRTQADLHQQLNDLKEEEKLLVDNRQKAESLKNDLKQLPGLKEEIEKLKLAKSRLEFQEQLQKQISTRKQEEQQAKKRVEVVRFEIEQYQKELSKYPDDIKAQLPRYQTELEETRKRYTQLRANKEALDVQTAKLQKQMESIAQIGPDSVCDRCLRPFGEDLPEIRKHLSEELNSLTKEAQKVSGELQSIREQGENLKKTVREKEKAVIKQQELKYKLTLSLKEQKAAQEAMATIADALKTICTQLDELGQIDFDSDHYIMLSAKLESLEQAQKQLDRLEGSLKRLPVVKENQIRIQKQVTRVSKELESLQKQTIQLDYSEDLFVTAQKNFEEAQKNLNTIKNEFIGISTELEVTAKELETQVERLQTLEKLGEQLESYRTNQYYGQKLAGLFSEFREYLIARIRPTLADFSSRLMSEMTNGKYSLVELDEKYNLRVMDTNQFYDVDRFSGGEKDLANLCLRLAISLALTESAGLSQSFIILDEVFGSQDNNRRELIISALANLKHRFPQILLITHIEDIRHRVETLIEVKPSGMGWSEVTVNGNA